jgi:Ca-activated chloride channel family protein
VLTTWRRDRKPADVELVLDNSGSMEQEGKLDAAKRGLQAFLKLLAPQDEVGLAKFSTRITPLVPPAPYGQNAKALAGALRDILPEDNTSLYDATLYGLDLVKRRSDGEHINAVVLLTDGEDTASSATERQALDRLRAEGQVETGGVRVFTIAYGADARANELNAFAAASGGKGFTASTSDIEQVYRSISSFF